MTQRSKTHIVLIQPCRLRWLAGTNGALMFFFIATVLIVLGLASTSPIQADGVVGTGTPESCTQSAFDEALTGGGTVTFNCGSDPATINITATKTIAVPTTIDGGGKITLSASGVGVFNVSSGKALTVSNLTVANGDNTVTGGGAIYNNGGKVTVSNVTFSQNIAYEGGSIYNNSGSTLSISESSFTGDINAPLSRGGGIYNAGIVTVTNSTLTAHQTTSLGGAIYNSGKAAINSSAVIYNIGARGAGIANDSGGILVVTNSTVASNTSTNDNIAGGGGGGIYSAGPMTLTNSTLTGNGAYIGGGIYVTATIATLRNTIVANSWAGGNCAGAITNGGYNLDSGTTCGFGSNGGSKSNTNPLLSPLANYGGPTQVAGLLPGSPAIDAVIGNANCPATDQRGITRPVGAWCDIGALEAILRVLYLPSILRNP